MKTPAFAAALLCSLLSLSSTSALSAEPVKQAKTADTPSMVVEKTIQYDYNKALDTVRQQLKEDGWKLIAEINLGTRLAKKGVEVPGGLVIFKLTSGKNAVPLLAADETRYVSAMMPCGLSVYGKQDGTVVISRMNFEMMSAMLEPKVAKVMTKSITKLNKTVESALAKMATN
ncbi:MAG: DUF302 domain-containing protein [Candidatus Thiodiazotropha sp. (ex. Lucinisca nassula)]|nr:DUF302 domain-containing protein [Candidatus Thiodiazotropha sp. (ex. Lucinisca nassula)]MBW9263359.1 DUF302 domain-containing protein [Candidatus Thiodiazotropha sp. (ex. Lucinisca nassula)]MBW9269047.1 DUF302 domain-containing protein [Candidatus Thiodiazotropha sp. (ex. Lucinisca nassula)]